ncbi:probable inactive purple acid phosphatase 2 [Magnolia sinica]|uniref:probable inactive purple acid phosphatase 2 n=1 Tax=Magnolia sinica TaxID=86752 RepID=UPI00265B1AD7|nr:probable inactive purple acid phosphatase 2 [Magnolia sinica]
MIRFPALLILLSFLLAPISTSATASISITPNVLTESGQSVQIQWSGIDSPSDLDWLGIFSPPNSSHSDFIGYIFLSSCSTWKSGSCTVHLPLVDLRSNYDFRIFRWSQSEVDHKHHDHDQNPLPGTKHLLARSEELRFDVRAPEQIHLSFTSEDDEMRVMFVTGDGEERFVNYGPDENRMDETARAEVMRYERSDMCDAPANDSVGWRDPGFIHDAVMVNLKKGKKYYYRVGSDTRGWSVTKSFVSRDWDSDETIAFLFGDMGASAPYSTFLRLQEESKLTVKWILRDIEALGDKPAFVSHIGDISYARGYAWLWDTFFNQIEPIASRVPYHVCIGNHEYDWPLQPWKPDWSLGIYNKDGGGECGVPYSLRFNMPGNSSLPTGTHSPNTRNLYYSFDAGVVHFVFMSTETDFLPGSDQYNFIKHDLENVDREKTPFIVFQGHRPMYTTSYESRDAPLREKMLEHLEPLLVKNKVTLALWGHVHRYERFCPMSNYTCGDISGNGEDLPVHAVIGMAGQDWQPIWQPRPDHLDLPIFPQPGRSMYRGGEFGYTRLFATREKLTLTYIGNHDGEEHDMVEIPSGRVLKGGNAVESRFSSYVKGGGILVLGAFLGYIVGFITRSKREAASGVSWTAVKSDEV